MTSQATPNGYLFTHRHWHHANRTGFLWTNCLHVDTQRRNMCLRSVSQTNALIKEDPILIQHDICLGYI